MLRSQLWYVPVRMRHSSLVTMCKMLCDTQAAASSAGRYLFIVIKVRILVTGRLEGNENILCLKHSFYWLTSNKLHIFGDRCWGRCGEDILYELIRLM